MSDEIRLIHGDCLEVIPTLEAGSVDAIITDPPYGIKVANRSDGGVASVSSGSKCYGRQAWDHEPASPEVLRLLLGMNVPTVIWGGNYFDLPPSSCYLIWNKMQKGFTFADAELAWTNLDKAVRMFDCSRGKLASEGKVHPTQKPFGLMRWCIEHLKLKPGATILDPYMGSGTTGLAAMKGGFRFIGIERDPVHFESARRRLKDAETPLFAEAR